MLIGCSHAKNSCENGIMAELKGIKPCSFKTPSSKLDHYHHHCYDRAHFAGVPDQPLIFTMGESSLVDRKSVINVSRAVARSARAMTGRSAQSSVLEQQRLRRQNNNYRHCEISENPVAAPVQLSFIMSTLNDHFANSRNPNTADNCCYPIGENNNNNCYQTSSQIVATPKSPMTTSRSTTLTTKSIETQSSESSSDPTGHLILACATTTITACNDDKLLENASDRNPNNSNVEVECRIPVVNANNECSRVATVTTPTPTGQIKTAEAPTRLKADKEVVELSSLECLNSDEKWCKSWKRLAFRKSELKVCNAKSDLWWQLVVAVYTLLLYISSTSVCWAARQEVASNCSFPSRWEGTWFLSGYQQSVHIRGSQFSYRGKCAASDGNKYLIVNDECHRCLVIYEKHKNVLQFKESECEGDNMYGDQSNPSPMAMRSVVKSDHRGGAHPNMNGHPRLSSSDQYIMRSNDDSNDCSFCKRRETLQNLCDQIAGDALLYSLFRENAEPVKCPLKGPFSFTYNRGHGECKSPVSNIESCTEESRLLLSFQACPDVQGTESTVEELTCLATWKDGNSRYLIGLVSQHHAHHLPALPHHALSNEERYRCFVYEKIQTMMSPMSNLNIKDAEYKLSQSGDATCNGLDSAEVGSRIMTLRKPPPAERCDFPAWFKAPRHWRALMGNIGYTFHQSDGSMHITSNGILETRALCEQINKQTQTEMMAVVHYTSQCESGFMCMTFYKRDMQVAEIQMGTPATRLEDACAPDHFDINKLPFVTLLASNPESQICPLEGSFSLRGAIGPPYITSRHKRNHNNKGHNQHGHHHHEQGHKRHGIQSFRNSEELGQTSWQSHTRGLSIRNRRAAVAAFAAAPPSLSGLANAILGSLPADSRIIVRDESKVITLSRRYRSNRLDDPAGTIVDVETLRTAEGGNVVFQDVSSSEKDNDEQHTANVRNSAKKQIAITQTDDAKVGSITQQRSRRDVPACMVNYKAQRQLLVGCTDTNLIEVRPRCNEDGEESYLCHGSWTENSTVYVVAKNQATQHGVCITYRQLDGNEGLLVVGDSCYRGLQKPPDHHFIANLTLAGKCGDTSATNSIHRHHTKWIWIELATIAATVAITTETVFRSILIR